jgi:hypothetical protein
MAVDQRYYAHVPPNSLSQRLMISARDRIFSGTMADQGCGWIVTCRAGSPMRNSQLPVAIDSCLAPTTKWEGKGNAPWLALSPPQRFKCEDYLPSLPPQSGFIASKAIERETWH